MRPLDTEGVNVNLRGWEWVILLAIVLLLFGARRLPDLARSVGRSMKIFRSEVKDLKQDDSASPASTPGATGTYEPGQPRTTDDDGERPRP
ncbi:Sec-independent protein translocase subunit TatA [Actinotalea solisilvae]|uniref:Sec-independent protein translocase subunit TatA n=1 Tax=Actinotalea solisilvae TaxID=2072922 RepID=UPI0018F236CE|nr:Sec-independent protein translocase subunit TatA [Actinotalea solisilvae]